MVAGEGEHKDLWGIRDERDEGWCYSGLLGSQIREVERPPRGATAPQILMLSIAAHHASFGLNIPATPGS